MRRAPSGTHLRRSRGASSGQLPRVGVGKDRGRARRPITPNSSKTVTGLPFALYRDRAGTYVQQFWWLPFVPHLLRSTRRELHMAPQPVVDNAATTRRTHIIRTVLAVLVIAPLSIAAFYMWALWDPGDTVNRLPVAIVNADAGTELDGTRLQAGDEVVAALVRERRRCMEGRLGTGSRRRRQRRHLLLLGRHSENFQRGCGQCRIRFGPQGRTRRLVQRLQQSGRRPGR